MLHYLIFSAPLCASSAFTDNQLIWHQSLRRTTHLFNIPGPVDEVTNKISHTLQKLREDLLSNPSKLKPIQDQHDEISHIEIGTDKLVQETLLSSRLPLRFLNRTRVAESTLPNAGRGLFATKDIAKGSLITCYPGDALLCEYYDDEEMNHDEEDHGQEYDEEDETEVILWGSHVNSMYRVDDDEIFDGRDDGMPPLVSYAASVNDVYSVIGMPSLDQDPAYLGHFANDGGGHIAQENFETMGIEDMLSLYIEKSSDVANAKHVPFGGGLHLGTMAIKDIKKNQEIFVTYGTDYWMSHFD
jgi:hypothetical protein